MQITAGNPRVVFRAVALPTDQVGDRPCSRMNTMAKNACDLEMVLTVGDDRRRWNRDPTRNQVVRAIRSEMADMENWVDLPRSG